MKTFGVGGVEMGERTEAGQEVPIAGRNSTETMKIFSPRNDAERSDFRKEEAGGR